MLSKCANPSCSIPFRYLHEGKLFRIHIPREDGQPSPVELESKKPVRQVEFFWLCHDCSTTMTLIFEKDAGVRTRPLKYMGAIAS